MHENLFFVQLVSPTNVKCTFNFPVLIRSYSIYLLRVHMCMFAMLYMFYKKNLFKSFDVIMHFGLNFSKKKTDEKKNKFSLSIHHRAHLNLFMFSTNYVNSEIKNFEWLTFFMHDSVKRETHLWHDMHKKKQSFIR